VSAFLVYPERAFPLFLRVDKKLAKGQMEEPNRSVVLGNTKYRVQRVESAPNLLWWNLKKARQ
jgi:hypothetical protein